MFEKTIDRIAAAAESMPICPDCGELRSEFKMRDETRMVRVMCRHQEAEKKAQDDRESAERWQAGRRAIAIERYHRKAPPPEQYLSLRLDGVDIRDCSLAGRQAATRLLQTWKERREEGQGLTFAGDIGTGKTMVAAATANELANLGYAVRFLTVTALQAKLKDWDNAQDIMADLKSVDLLVLDDFGQERVTEWSSSTLFDLVDSRYQDKRPTILTTNLGAKQMRDHYIRSLTNGRDEMPADQAALTVDRVLSRLKQRNATIVFTGTDQRLGGSHDWLTGMEAG